MRTMISKDFINSQENITIIKRVQNSKVPEHTHEFIEIVYIAGGSGIHAINGKPYFVERGDILIFNIGDIHTVDPRNEFHVVNTLLNPEFVNSELVDCHDAIDLLALTSFREFEDSIDNFPPKIHFPGKDLIDAENIIDSMLREFSEKSIGYKTVLKGYLNVLMAKIFRIIYEEGKVDVRNNLDDLFPEILEYIEKNYHKKITLGELAGKSFYNPSYFGQIFKECFNMTPMEYINYRRITEATRILQEENYSVEQVCLMVGYRDKKQFYKLFKQYTGQTPGQFRHRS